MKKNIFLALFLLFARLTEAQITINNTTLGIQDVVSTVGQSNPSVFKSYQIDSKEIVRKSKDKIRVVFLGSSNMQGAGASTYANSWAGRLQAYLEGLGGYEVRNVSIAGTNSSVSLARFYTDVIVWNPSIVIEGTALWNWGFWGGNYNATNTDLLSCGQLENMCSQYGIRFLKAPALVSYNATDQAKKLSIFKSYCSTLDKYMIGDASCLVDSITLNSSVNVGDNVHVNDIGHESVYNSINKYRITHSFLAGRLPKYTQNVQRTYIEISSNNQVPATGFQIANVNLSSYLFSYNLYIEQPDVWGRTLCYLSSNLADRLRLNAGTIQGTYSIDYVNTNGVATVIKDSIQINTMSAITVSYNQLSKKLVIRINNRILTRTIDFTAPQTFICMSNVNNGGNNIFGCSIANIQLYNSCFSDYEQTEIHKGRIFERSNLLYSPMGDANIVVGSRFVNLACSPLYIENLFANTIAK